MKLRVTAGVCILAAIVAGGLWDLQRSSAQPSNPAPVPQQPVGADVFISAAEAPAPLPGEAPILSPSRPRVFQYHGADKGIFTVRSADDKIIRLKTNLLHHQATDALRQAAAALRDAKDDVAKLAAQGQLTQLLDKVFEDDMNRREQELAQIEQRTKDLRALMGRRREKQNEIIELQIKVLLNEAEGLGFFNESPMPTPAFPVPTRDDIDVVDPEWSKGPAKTWNSSPLPGTELVPSQPQTRNPAATIEPLR